VLDERREEIARRKWDFDLHEENDQQWGQYAKYHLTFEDDTEDH
jgi:hypothetical protein